MKKVVVCFTLICSLFLLSNVSMACDCGCNKIGVSEETGCTKSDNCKCQKGDDCECKKAKCDKEKSLIDEINENVLSDDAQVDDSKKCKCKKSKCCKKSKKCKKSKCCKKIKKCKKGCKVKDIIDKDSEALEN